MLFTVAMPEWSVEAAAQVQVCRQRNDPQYALIGPHFTLIFGVPLDEVLCVEHVGRIARDTSPIRFVLRRAQVQTDGAGVSRVFLVPDEGANALVALHDQLYGGMFAPWRSLQEAFTPHVTVAAFDQPTVAQSLADRWNAQPFALAGSLRALTVGRLADSRFEVLAVLPLERRA